LEETRENYGGDAGYEGIVLNQWEACHV